MRLQMLWTSSMAIGDAIYIVLSKHHGSLSIDETRDAIDPTTDSQNLGTRAIDLILMNGDP